MSSMNTPVARLLAGLAMSLGLCTIAPPALAQDWPARPLRVIIPYPAGDTGDVIVRLISSQLAQRLGQPVVADNRAGASGQIGLELAARALPDGYTITVGQAGNVAAAPHTARKLGYDPLRDFAPIALVARNHLSFAVHPSTPWRTVPELISWAKANPGKLTFASSSSGPWIAGELFRLTTGTNMVHVPYKGGAPATAALLGGEVSVMFTVPFTTVPQVKAGRLRVLMVLARSRIDALPEVPTAVEAGYPDLANVSEWYGVIAPAGTPRAALSRLNAAVVQALQSSDVQKRLAELGLAAAPSTPEAFGQMIREEYLRWGKVVKASGARLE